MLYSSRTVRTVRAFAFFTLGLGWLTTAWAVSSSTPDLLGLPWLQIAFGGLLSLWGGLTRTAQTMVQALQADPPRPFRLWLELLKDVVTSSGIGFLAFSLGAWRGFGEWEMAGAAGSTAGGCSR